MNDTDRVCKNIQSDIKYRTLAYHMIMPPLPSDGKINNHDAVFSLNNNDKPAEASV